MRRSISHYGLAIAEYTGQTALPARKTYALVLSGKLPALYENGRWYFDDADVAVAAERLGLNAV